MAIPLLRFVSSSDHYDVIIENLTKLAVPQIQQLEQFAEARRGRLDFEKASFRIYKRIDFHYFNKILEQSGIVADTIESEIKKHEIVTDSIEPVIGFGKYRGMKYAELPTEYLYWLKQNYRGPDRSHIDQECFKRSI